MAVVLQEVRDSGLYSRGRVMVASEANGVDYDWRLVLTGDIDYQFYLNQCAQYPRRGGEIGCGYYPALPQPADGASSGGD